MVILADIHPK